jgi:CheY-like chemotaxis protein
MLTHNPENFFNSKSITKNSDNRPLYEILIIDDLFMNRKILQNILSKFFTIKTITHNLDLVDSGDEALRCIKEKYEKGGMYQTLFVDYNLPGTMNGEELIKKIEPFLSLRTISPVIISWTNAIQTTSAHLSLNKKITYTIIDNLFTNIIIPMHSQDRFHFNFSINHPDSVCRNA